MTTLRTIKATFKSVRSIQVKHERGSEKLNNVVGKVIKITPTRVFLEGLAYNFSISLSDFENYNIATK